MIKWLQGYPEIFTYVREISNQSWHTNCETPCSYIQLTKRFQLLKTSLPRTLQCLAAKELPWDYVGNYTFDWRKNGGPIDKDDMVEEVFMPTAAGVFVKFGLILKLGSIEESAVYREERSKKLIGFWFWWNIKPTPLLYTNSSETITISKLSDPIQDPINANVQLYRDGSEVDHDDHPLARSRSSQEGGRRECVRRHEPKSQA